MLRGVRRVDRGGETRDENAGDVFETEILVRPFMFGCMLCHGGCGGGGDHHCSSVGKLRQQVYEEVLEDDQAAKKLGWRGRMSCRRNQLPLAADACDLGGGGGSSAAVRGGAGGAGSVSVSPSVIPLGCRWTRLSAGRWKLSWFSSGHLPLLGAGGPRWRCGPDACGERCTI